jgi:hypothetical protein
VGKHAKRKASDEVNDRGSIGYRVRRVAYICTRDPAFSQMCRGEASYSDQLIEI